MRRRASKFARQEDANRRRNAEEWRRGSRRAPEAHAEMGLEEVLEELRAFNPQKAQGQDDIPAFLLKGCADELAPWLARLFRALCSGGVVPQQWLKGRTILLAKDASGDPSKFRPVTLLSRVRLLFEKLLHRRVRPLMPTHPLQGGIQGWPPLPPLGRHPTGCAQEQGGPPEAAPRGYARLLSGIRHREPRGHSGRGAPEPLEEPRSQPGRVPAAPDPRYRQLAAAGEGTPREECCPPFCLIGRQRGCRERW